MALKQQPNLYINHIEQALLNCRELSGLCMRGGWIDSDTLHYRIVHRTDRQVLALVQFEEIITPTPGSHAPRFPCGGRVRLYLDWYGAVDRIELL